MEIVGPAAGQTADGFHALRLAQLVFQGFAFGDIDGDADDVARSAFFVADQIQVEVGEDALAVAQEVTLLAAVVFKLSGKHLWKLHSVSSAVFGMRKLVKDRDILKVVRTEAQHLAASGIGGNYASVFSEHRHGDGRAVEDCAEALFALG